MAQAYAGHQFGGYSPRLGDGRALLLGELTDTDGAVATCTSRAPGVRRSPAAATVWPRSARCCASTSSARRCTPWASPPPARSPWWRRAGRCTARRCCPAPSWPGSPAVTCGWAASSTPGRPATSTCCAASPTTRSAVTTRGAADAENPYLALFEAVVAAQASLVAQWMLVGFVHGVMNTDNMTISGETIDYGPCAFMEAFDPATVYSSIDGGGRYAYGNQPVVAEWNLARLAEALLPLLASTTRSRRLPRRWSRSVRFGRQYSAAWSAGHAGQARPAGRPGRGVTAPLIRELLTQLEQSHVDYTSFFRSLAAAARGDVEPARGVFLDLTAFDAWLERWRALDPDAAGMDRVNPAYIPRNHLVEEALTAATEGDLDPLDRLLTPRPRPYDERAGLERYADAAPVDFGDYRTFCGT